MRERYDLVTFGEMMIRLSSSSFRRLEQTSFLKANVGASELNNVVVAAQRLGLKRVCEQPLETDDRECRHLENADLCVSLGGKYNGLRERDEVEWITGYV